jgi:hypothetical protein
LQEIAMIFDGAVIRQQGVTFALVVVKHHVVQSHFDAARAGSSFQTCFPGMPIVLVGQDSRGMPTYFGRPDIARFMASVPISAVPWKRYTI